jgi:hypothetical protein
MLCCLDDSNLKGSLRGWILEAKVQLLDSERCEDSERANQAVRGCFQVPFFLRDALAEGGRRARFPQAAARRDAIAGALKRDALCD